MKLRKEFITHQVGDEYMVVPLGGTSFSGLVRGNVTAGMIFDCLKDGADEDEIVNVLLSKYEAPEEKIRKDVRDIIAKLDKIGAIQH